MAPVTTTLSTQCIYFITKSKCHGSPDQPEEGPSGRPQWGDPARRHWASPGGFALPQRLHVASPWYWDTLAVPGIEPGMAACLASWLTIKPDDISANKLFWHIFCRDHKY